MYQSPRNQNQYNNRGANNISNNSNNNQRFRNPLHQNKSLSPKTPTLPPAATNAFAPQQYNSFQPMNPFYEAWKSDTAMNRSVNFANLVQNSNVRSAPPTMKMMSEVEQGIIQSSQSAHGNANNGANNIQQFFQNFSSTNSNFNPHASVFNMNQQQQQQQRVPETFPTFPTAEQLHQHTSEILRKAILRNREQQYHDENNQQ